MLSILARNFSGIGCITDTQWNATRDHWEAILFTFFVVPNWCTRYCTTRASVKSDVRQSSSVHRSIDKRK